MPELPDVAVYIEALEARILGETFEGVRLTSPFLLRTVEPTLGECTGRRAVEIRRVGKRIAVGLEGELWMVLHLMIGGRLQWKPRGAKPPGRRGLAAFDFSSGTLLLTEAGTKKRAALHLAAGELGLRALDPGGIEPLVCDAETFAETLRRENHTLRRSLTDPKLFSGIGGAYSDEILHRARLSPLKLTQKLDDDQIERLFEATQTTLNEWVERLRGECGDGFPTKVTAFRKEMAVHGRYGQPCPVCATPVQRIRYAANEANYCPGCQTGGKLLADRAMSRLLKQDWPRTLDELEARREARTPGA